MTQASSPSPIDPGLPERLNDGVTDAERLAERAARQMWAEDSASRGLGMQLLRVTPGTATIRMPVRSDMTNGHGICHGGFIFLLADSTFAFACNSHNQRCVAAGAEVHFLAPGHSGQLLTAIGQEVHRAGRSGIYDIRVSNEDGDLVAVFRGRSATIRGHLVESTPSE